MILLINLTRNTVRALTVTFSVHPEAFHRFLVHNQTLLAFEETVMYGVRADL